MGGGVLLAGRLTWRARRAPAATGPESLVGRVVRVRKADGRTGQAFLDGAWWQIRSEYTELTEGRRVAVVGTDGLELIVEEEKT